MKDIMGQKQVHRRPDGRIACAFDKPTGCTSLLVPGCLTTARVHGQHTWPGIAALMLPLWKAVNHLLPLLQVPDDPRLAISVARRGKVLHMLLSTQELHD